MSKSVLFLLSLCVCASFGAQTDIASDYYRVVVDDDTGLWAVSTGQKHPAGDNKDILFGAVDKIPYTSYLSVHLYSSGTTYTNNEDVNTDSGASLLDIVSVTPVNSAQCKIELENTAADFTVTVTISLVGNNFAESGVLYSAKVTAGSTFTAQKVGVRWFMDYQINDDDGSALSTYKPTSGAYLYEHEWTEPNFEKYRVSSNNDEPTYYEVYSTVNANGFTAKDKIQFISVDAQFYKPFDITVQDENQVVRQTTTDDSAATEFFGGSASDGYTLNANSNQEWTARLDTVVLQYKDGAIDCNDQWACTYDYINVKSGIQECIHIGQNYPCDDENPCTIDVCEQHNPLGYLDEAGCMHIEKDCSDGVACTIDTCNEENGNCEHEATSCNDDVDCTHDVCSEEYGGCVNTPVDSACSEGEDLCNTWYCDQYYGCRSDEKDCDDQTFCTTDSCDPEVGCVYEAEHAACDDHVECTHDFCDKNTHKCENVADDSECDDGEAGTIDYCDVVKGCQSYTKICDYPDADNTACLIHRFLEGDCVALAEDFLCDDKVDCTVDVCDPNLGECTNTKDDLFCEDENVCTNTWCDAKLGCKSSPYEGCDDWIACTVDSCSEEKQACEYVPENARCDDDGLSCTVDICDPVEGCKRSFENSLCDDMNECTRDYCLGTTALGHPDADVDATTGCVHVPIVCDDDIHCTTDECVDGQCVFTFVDSACNDEVECTHDTCDEDLERCRNDPWDSNCNDDVDCTVDVCDGTDGCVFYPNNKTCEDDIECTLNWCDATEGCKLTEQHDHCDDHVDCTTNMCSSVHGCQYIPDDSACVDDIHDCTTQTCTENGCETLFDNDQCDDGIDCTVDECTRDGCIHTAYHSLCNDDVGCTHDVCDNVTAGGCIYIAVHELCSDGRNCSSETCDVTLGCIMDDSSCPRDESCEHCIGCKSGLSRIVVNDMEDGSGELILKTRNQAVAPFSIASATKDLTENIVFKGDGSIVVGDEEFLDVDDGLVIASNSNFKLVPHTEDQNDTVTCNVLTRGLIKFVEEDVETEKQDGSVQIDRVDNMYICLNNEGESVWTLLRGN